MTSARPRGRARSLLLQTRTLLAVGWSGVSASREVIARQPRWPKVHLTRAIMVRRSQGLVLARWLWAPIWPPETVPGVRRAGLIHR